VLPAARLDRAETDGLLLYECSIGRSLRVKEYSFALPAWRHAIDVALSRNGKQLAFIMRKHRHRVVSTLETMSRDPETARYDAEIEGFEGLERP